MRKLAVTALFIIVGIVGVVGQGTFVPVLDRAEKTLFIGDPGMWSVYDYERDGQRAGFGVRLVEKVAEMLGGYQLKLVATTWPEMAKDVSEGKFDTMFSPIFVTPERDVLADFVPYACFSTVAAIVRTGEARFNTIEALLSATGVTIAVVDGFAAHEWAETHLGDKNTISPLATIGDVFNGLASARADLALMDLRSALDEQAGRADGSIFEIRFQKLAGESTGGFITNPVDSDFALFLREALKTLAIEGWLQQVAGEEKAAEVLQSWRTAAEYQAGAPLELPKCRGEGS